MASPSGLREIGLEGFALIDTFFGAPAAPRRPIFNNRVFPARQGRWVPNDEMEEPPMNSSEVAARYGGIMVVNYPKGKPQARVGRSFANHRH